MRVKSLNDLRQMREKIVKIGQQHGVFNIRVFGSVARQTEEEDSDVDLLVSLESERSLLDLGGFQMDMQELMGCKVDVVTEPGLRERIRERVLSEAQQL